MTISNSFALANDSEFRLLANFTTPPRAGRITAVEPSGQVRVATDDPDGGDVLAWPLNGFTYAVDDVVYIAFAANSPDTAIVIGAKAPLPTLDAAVYTHVHDDAYADIAHAHDNAYVKQDGTTALDADWDIGENRRIQAEALRARDGEGLRLEDDAGNLGLLVEDGGDVGIGIASPAKKLHIYGNEAGTNIAARVEDAHSGGVASLQALNDEADFLQFAMWGSAFGGSVFGEARSGHGTFEYSGAGKFLLGTIGASELGLGTNNVRRATITASGDMGVGTSSPQGKFHIHDGTGGLIFVSKTGIGNVAQTIIANGAGDVTGGITGFFVVNDGGGAVANTLTMVPGDHLDVAVGSYVLRLALNVNGALTAVRQSGTGTATLVLLAVWL